jgi:hypothetical protein
MYLYTGAKIEKERAHCWLQTLKEGLKSIPTAPIVGPM